MLRDFGRQSTIIRLVRVGKFFIHCWIAGEIVVLKEELAHSIESSVIEIFTFKSQSIQLPVFRITFSKQMFFCQSNFLLAYRFAFRIQSLRSFPPFL